MELRERLGLSYLFISHDLTAVRRVCNRVAIMYLGKIVETGATEQIFDQPLHPYSRALLSSVLYPDPTRSAALRAERRDPEPDRSSGGLPSAPALPLGEPACQRAYPPLETLSTRALRRMFSKHRRDGVRTRGNAVPGGGRSHRVRAVQERDLLDRRRDGADHLRTAYSGVLKDNMDYSTAFCDAGGRLVAQGLTLPGHLGSIPTALAAVMRRYGDAMRPGDVFVLNDPFEGGMHLPDIFVFKPIFARARRLAFAATDLPPHRRGRARRRLQRLGLHRDLPGGPAHPAAQALRRRRAQRDAVRASSRRTCACPCGCSATCARSSPPATSPSSRSSSSSSATGREVAAPTWRR